MSTIVKFTLDDGFYYFKIAANIADGKGSTFDGIHLTDGYHPLWAWLLVLLFKLTDDPFVRVRLALTLTQVFGLAATYLLYRLLRPRFGMTVATLAAGLYGTSRAVFADQITGQEFALFAFLMVLTVLLWERTSTCLTYSRLALVGGVMGLTVLSRLDAILMLPASILCLWLRQRPNVSSWFVSSAILVAVCGMVIVPYFAWKLPATKRVMTVSGRIKTWWGQKELPRLFGKEHFRVSLREMVITDAKDAALPIRTLFEPFLSRMGRARPIATLLVAYAIWVVASVGVKYILSEALGIRLLFGYGILHYLAYGIWLLGNYQGYQTPEFLLITVLTAIGLKRGWEFLKGCRNHNIFAPIMVLGVVVYSGILTANYIRHYTLSSAEHNPHSDLFQMAVWMQSHIPQNAKVGAWSAGILGYFSQRCVINLDGLVNSHDYFGKRSEQQIISVKRVFAS